MYMGNQKTPLSALEKKVPRNPKYAQVRGNLDTGKSVSKIKAISTKEFLKRQNELFARIRARELVDLLELGHLSVREEDEDGADGARLAQKPIVGERSLSSRGPIGDYETDRNLELEAAKLKCDQDLSQSVLVLDVREHAEYQVCHIKTAVSYPLVNLHQDRLTPSMYRFKNKAGKEIVVYDEDERLAAQGATALVERGFDNVRMLTGGLRTFGNLCGHLLEGALPERLVQRQCVSPTESTATRREERRRRRSAEMSPRDTGASYSPSLAGSTASSVVSRRSTFSRAPRWKEDRSSAQRHREVVAKMHHEPS